MTNNINLPAQKHAAEEIVKKYHHSLSNLYDHATAQELQTVMLYIANEANHKQRLVAGLDHE